MRWCWNDFALYKSIGINDDNIIPVSIYSTLVIPAFNPLNDRKCLANKAMLFYLKNVRQPEFIIRSVNGIIFDKKNQILSKEDAIKVLEGYDETLVFKRAVETSGGTGVTIVSPRNIELSKLLDHLGDTFIIQKKIKQSDYLNSLNNTSLNTLRCTTLLLEDGPHLVSAQLKISKAGATLDNAAYGSAFVGINEDGSLKEYGYVKGLKRVEEQNGIKFKGLKIPNWEAVREFVEENALKLASCRIIGWDIAIDENDQPLLIEANLNCPGITIEQACSGAIFGKYTDRVIQTVLKNSNAGS